MAGAVCTPDASGITYNESVNVALAVSMPDGGLITPVLTNADTTDIYQLSRNWAVRLPPAALPTHISGIRYWHADRSCSRLLHTRPQPCWQAECMSAQRSRACSSHGVCHVQDLVKRARNKQLSPNEYSTGNFTISNMGMYGADAFDAILPPGVHCTAVLAD